MPVILGNASLKSALLNDGFIKGGNVENIDGIKYDFCLSSKLLKARYKQPVDISNFPDTLKKDLVVEPGEVVFVLTEETILLPDNIMAILIPKRKLSHDGIMILGGLSIDPLYEGRLLIGLYNLSSTPYPIIQGKKLIGCHFYKLSDEEKDNVSKPQVKIYDFPDELVRLMQSYKPVSTEALLSNISNLEIKFDNLLQEFRSKDDWFEKLQNSMDRHEKNIDKILVGLEKEGEDRRNSDKVLDDKVDGFRGEIKEYMKSAYRTAGIVGISGALIISLIFYFIQYLDRAKEERKYQPSQYQPINNDNNQKEKNNTSKDTVSLIK